MSKLFKIFLLLILVTLIFNKKIISYYYIEKFSSWVERPVEIGHLNFEYSGLVVIEDIRILNLDENYYQNIFQAEKISFDFDVKSLISNLIIINNLDITNPEFSLDIKILEKKENTDNNKTSYEDNLGLAQKLNEKTPDKIWPEKDKDVNFIVRRAVLSGTTANIKVSSIPDAAQINLSEMMFSSFGNEKGYQHYKDILKIILFDLYARTENRRLKKTLKKIYNF
jgi:hypothetical protein|tara:strand:- start:148 stop:822 length:675 start_codon:yes stop_codon:yes gene_type:complete